MRQKFHKDGLQTAAYWRERAKEAKGIAAGMVDLRVKAAMEDIADRYMFIAELAAEPGHRRPGDVVDQDRR